MDECVMEHECISPRLLWIRLKVGLTRLFILGVYSPTDLRGGGSIKTQQEREEFWDSMREVLNKCGENERIVMLGDFNGWVGVKRDGYEGVLGTFGDERVNDNGRSLLEVCLEWNLCVANTMFDHKKIHLYTRDEGESRSMIDFVIVDERLRKKVLDTRAYRGVGLDTDHFLVIARMRGLFKRWRHRVAEPTSVLDRVKVENLQEEEKKDEYVEKLKESFKGIEEIGVIEDLWETFKKGVVNVAIEVCGVAKRRKGRKNDNVWMDKDVQKVVQEKKKAWLDWLATKANQKVQKATDDVIKEARTKYKRLKTAAKEIVSRKKEERKDDFDRRLTEDFQSNIKFFWKTIKTARGKSSTSELSTIRSQDGSIIKGEEYVLKRWKEYFESLFEREEVQVQHLPPSTETNISVDEYEISMDEIVKALKSMRLGKAAGYDRITVEMLRAGQGLVASQLYRLFNLAAPWRSGLAISCCAGGRGFESRTEQVFVWPTNIVPGLDVCPCAIYVCKLPPRHRRKS
ncbi:unnamed protein product [Parnassius mnemosyne]|uniref:Endonuclease/exonuclease/phosphatase domain-containing protein n=1 Tax=Parnassius mnemosyne TaxID=213953 RepID=A0AAV1M6L9_9NEOP